MVMDRVSEPDFDCSDIDRAEIDTIAFTVAGGQCSEELVVDTPFDDDVLLACRPWRRVAAARKGIPWLWLGAQLEVFHVCR